MCKRDGTEVVPDFASFVCAVALVLFLNVMCLFSSEESASLLKQLPFERGKMLFVAYAVDCVLSWNIHFLVFSHICCFSLI